jgi:hypothetical protein
MASSATTFDKSKTKTMIHSDAEVYTETSKRELEKDQPEKSSR